MDLFFIQIAAILIIILAIIFYFSIQYFELAIFIVFFIPRITDFFFLDLTGNEIETESGIGSYIRVGTYIFIGFIGLFKFIQHWNTHKGRIPYHFILFFVFISFGFISISYSIDPFISFIRSSTIFFQFLFLLGLYYWLEEEKKVDNTYQTLYILSIVFIAFNLIVTVLFPSRVWYAPDPDRYMGFFTQPNTLGEYCTLFTPIILWKIFNIRERNGIIISSIILLTNIIFLLLSGSRTSILLTLIIVTLWLYFRKKKLWLVIWLIVLTIGVVWAIEFLPENLKRKDREITTLTGRDDFWSGGLILLSEQPWLGYGYQVEGKIWEDSRFYDPNYKLWSGTSRTSLHNGYLSVAIGLGVPGLILFLTIIFLPLIKLKLNKINKNLIVAITILISFYIGNFVEAAIGFTFWFFWVIATRYTLTSSKLTNQQSMSNIEK